MSVATPVTTESVPPRPTSRVRRGFRTRMLVYSAVIALAVLGLPWFIYPPVAMDIAAWTLFAMSIDLLLGFTGLLSFGHAAFWGSSAYTSGLIAIHTPVPFPVAVLGGTLFAMLIAIPIGALSSRLSGIYFAMVTLAFAQMIFFLANRLQGLTGGENGLQGIPRNFFGIEAVETGSFYFYYAGLAILAVGAIAAWRIVTSPFGRVLVAIRDNPDRARALGYDVERYKTVVFVLSAGLGGMAGGIFAISHGFASLQDLYWTTSGRAVLITVLGGIGTLWGGGIGALIIITMEDRLTTSGFEATGLITGLVFIVTVLLFRQGVYGTARSLLRRIGDRRSGHS